MARPKYNNNLFFYIKSTINQILNLEYGIRAAILTSPTELQALAEINEKIRVMWIKLGMKQRYIDREHLIEKAWDSIQIGFPMRHRMGVFYENIEEASDIQTGLNLIRHEYIKAVQDIDLPAANYYRIFDLLNGADIKKLLEYTGQTVKEMKQYDNKDEIGLQSFLHSFTLPVPLHPAVRFVSHEPSDERTTPSFGIFIDTKAQLSFPDLDIQLREFMYQYAIFRSKELKGRSGDKCCSDIVANFYQDALSGAETDFVSRYDAIIGTVAGLLCWDTQNTYTRENRKSPLIDASVYVSSLYEQWALFPEKSTEKKGRGDPTHTIEGHYYKADESIQELAIRFNTIIENRPRTARDYPFAIRSK